MSIEDASPPFGMWVVGCPDMLPSRYGRPLSLDVDVVFCRGAKSALLRAIGLSGGAVRPSHPVVERREEK